MPQRDSTDQRWTILTVAMLVFSFLIAVAILGTRNLYDDEILSLPIITSTPRLIIRFANTADVHPAGMYLLTHFAWLLLPSFRWMNLIPTAVLWAGLAAFVLGFAPLFRRPLPLAMFALIATLHPQVLLWATSYRWYSWWTGLALGTIVIVLQPAAREPSLSKARSVAVGVLLGALFYINSITLLFAVALAAGTALRYRSQALRDRVVAAVAVCVVFLGCTAPQLHTFVTTQMERSGSQRSGIASSFAHLAYAMFASEAYLPWHPLAIVVAVTMMAMLAASVLSTIAEDTTAHPRHALSSLVVVGGCLLLLIAASGLGGRPRNALVLVPLLAAALALAAERLPRRIQRLALGLVILWISVGIGHMLTRTGLAKATMIDRPEEVTAYIDSTSNGCAVVITPDPLLTFALSHLARRNLMLLSQFAAPIAQSASEPGCAEPTLYVVRSYIGSSAEWAARIASELDAATAMISGQTQTRSFSFDPDARQKRQLSAIGIFGGDLENSARLPYYRYTVTAGRIFAADLDQLRVRLPDFCTPNQCPSPVALTSEQP